MPIIWLLTLAFWLTVIAGGGYLVVRFLRAYERRGALPAELTALEERVRLLEESVGRLEAGFTELTEAQQFTTKLLSDRT